MGDSKPVLLLIHGLSPDDGPHYPLLQCFHQRAQKMGFRVIMPDLRPTYGDVARHEYKSHSSHAKRVKIVVDLIRGLARQGIAVVLVGHSQGGAACARACLAFDANEVDIRGLLMIGSEYPHKAPHNMSSRPAVSRIEIIHAEGDGMIPLTPDDGNGMHELATLWNCPLHVLRSEFAYGARDQHNDDINHEFLPRSLMLPATRHFASFLEASKSRHVQPCRHGPRTPCSPGRRPVQLKVIPSGVAPRFPTCNHRFLDGQADLSVIQDQVSRLPDGTVMPCRARDGPQHKWDYGLGTKDGGSMHFKYSSGDKETFDISTIQFGKLVQLEIA